MLTFALELFQVQLYNLYYIKQRLVPVLSGCSSSGLVPGLGLARFFRILSTRSIFDFENKLTDKNQQMVKLSLGAVI